MATIATTTTTYGKIPTSAFKYLSFIEKASKAYNVPVTIIAWMIDHESKGNPKAWNPNNSENSRGLMQVSENAAISTPLNMKKENFDTLYDPQTNIMTATKLLSYYRDNLAKILPKDIDQVILWNCATSSFNQGWGYYKWAIESLTKDGSKLTWDNIVNRVNNPTTTTKKPWYDSVMTYAKSTVGNIDPNTLRTVAVSAGIGLGTVVVIGLALYFISRAKQGQMA
jgi:hypothetical protein